MVDGSLGPGLAEGDPFGDPLEDEVSLLLRRRLRLEELPPSADEAVPGDELVPEPGDRVAGVDRVEPEGDLGQLDGSGVEVDAVDVVVGEVGLDLLLLEEEAVVRDPRPGLSLLPFEISLRQLLTASLAKAPLPRAGSQMVIERMSSAVRSFSSSFSAYLTTQRVRTSGV